MELPIIDGRKCVPLRFVRFITCGRISPDTLLKLLCHEEGDERRPLFAYHADGTKIPSNSWRDIARMVESLSERPNLTDDEWIVKSNSELPAGVFVWHDELESYLHRCFNPSVEFNYSPIIPNELKQSMFDGFEQNKFSYCLRFLTRLSYPPKTIESSLTILAENTHFH